MIVMLAVAAAHCADNSQSELESAEQALNAENYQEAYDRANTVLTAEPTNLEAARIASSALFGLSNLDLTTLNTALLELQDSATADFAQIATAVPSDADLDNLIASAAVFRDFQGTLDDDAEFQEGLYEAYASFVIGIVASGYNTGEANFDATAITADDAAAAETALLSFDDSFVASGVAEGEDILQPREAYCLVVGNSGNGSFDAGVYRALVGCQLFEDQFDTTLVTNAIANCNALNPSNQGAVVFPGGRTFDECKAANTGN